MSEYRGQIDKSIEDRIRRFPTADLILLLYPNARRKGRSVFFSPFRNEKSPSLSCRRDRNGISRWHDFGTQEDGDNIDFFRKAFPSLNYVDAVDNLSMLLFNQTALTYGRSVRVSGKPVAARASAKPSEPVQRVVSLSSFLSPGTPEHLVDYVRGRGISDEVSSRFCLSVVYENRNMKGSYVMDPVSHIPLLDDEGNPLISDGRQAAVAIPNDIGGYSIRVPDLPGRKGFKTCDVMFFSTFYADGSIPSKSVSFVGSGSGIVGIPRYDARTGLMMVNETQGFSGLNPYAAGFAIPFLQTWNGRVLEGRDLKAAVAVLNGMNGPISPSVKVVEGMFDGLSVMEIRRLSGGGAVPGTDLVILNSVSNLSWAIPFLAMHSEVRSYLDNDKGFMAGQKAYSVMQTEVAAYASRCGSYTKVCSDSMFFSPYKDLNEFLCASMGLAGAGSPAEKKKPDDQNPGDDALKRRAFNGEVKF